MEEGMTYRIILNENPAKILEVNSIDYESYKEWGGNLR